MSQTAIYVLVLIFVVIRFLMRELRERRLTNTQLFVLPTIVWAGALVLAGTVAATQPARIEELVLESLVAVPIGVVVGYLVARFTSVRVDAGGTVRFIGSYVTVAIWIVALLLRVGVRFAILRGQTLDEQTVANAALVVLIAAALTAVRFFVWRKATLERRKGSAAAEPAV